MNNNKNQDIIKIVNASCWKCGKQMKISLAISVGTFYGPAEFTEKQMKFVKERGVILKEQFSKTSQERYLANTCGDCGSFIGDFFIHEYLDEGEDFKLVD